MAGIILVMVGITIASYSIGVIVGINVHKFDERNKNAEEESA